VSSLFLSDLKNGETAVIKEVPLDEAPVRFFELGIVPGTVITIYKNMPLGGPISFTVKNGGNLALRRSEAKLITVERQ